MKDNELVADGMTRRRYGGSDGGLSAIIGR